jgi:hypothetical protein
VLVRRLLLLAVALIVLAGLAAAIAPRPAVRRSAALPTSLPPGKTITMEIPAGPGSDTTVSVRRGDLLDLYVSGDVLDSVELERLDRATAIAPEARAHFNMIVEAEPGTYPIRLVQADRRIGAIEIRN